MTPIALWFLISVAGNGTVSHDTYPTEQACLEARNLILHGMTIEAEAEQLKANKESDARDAIRDAKEKAAWNAAHPARLATAKERAAHQEPYVVWPDDGSSPKMAS